MNKLFLIFLLFVNQISYAQNPNFIKEVDKNVFYDDCGRVNRGSSVVPSNDDCSNAISLSVNSPCVIGTTDQGTLQVGEPQPPCATLTFNQSIWYRFVATANRMYVQLELSTVIGGLMSSGRWVSAVYHSNSCLPTISSLVSCQTANSVGSADGVIENIMNGLIVGDTYYIQVAYGVGGGVSGVPEFCIQVGDQFTPTCNTCQSPCGQACGFSTTPSVNQVVNNCTSFEQLPYNEGTSLVNQCYTFRAVNSTVNFNIIVNSTCGSTGNVTNFTYNLYSSACGSPIQTGNLSNLTFNNLISGQWYTFCYNFNVPSGCYHTAYWPYFVGAAPLPVDLIEFKGEFQNNKIILSWSTASEINNDYFIIEKSNDGVNYVYCNKIYGFGNKSTITNYSYCDYKINNTFIYYRLSQFDYDGVKTIFDPIVIKIPKETDNNFKIVNVLGQEVDETYEGLKFYIQK